MTTKILFLIPARGGSKGIPAKNLQPLGGIPLVGRSCRVAREAAALVGKPCRIVCSTDDEKIADAARTWGAEVPWLRPAELASDSAKSVDVVYHALDALGEDFDVVVLIQPTSPFVEAEDVAGAIRLYEETGQPVISVCLNEHPIAWSYFMDAERGLSPVTQRDAPRRRQDAAASYRANGAVYIASPSVLRKQGSFVGEGTRGFVMPAERSIDIDTPSDLQAARAVLARRPPAPLPLTGQSIGPGQPPVIIAEAGVNHHGDPDLVRAPEQRGVALSSELLARLRGKLIVSCQDYTKVMVKAALRGGAAGLRINSPQDVRTTRQLTSVPILGCNKMWLPNSPIYITPSIRAAVALLRAGADLVALDCTARPRARQQPAEIIAAIHAAGGLAVADLSCVEEAAAAVRAGADILATTLAADFDVEFVRALTTFGLPVLAEGHINTPEAARGALEAGAWAVCVGSAITRPHLLTEQFKNALGT